MPKPSTVRCPRAGIVTSAVTVMPCVNDISAGPVAPATEAPVSFRRAGSVLGFHHPPPAFTLAPVPPHTPHSTVPLHVAHLGPSTPEQTQHLPEPSQAAHGGGQSSRE